MKLRIRFVILLSGLLVFMPPVAQGEVVSLKECLVTAMENNPSLAEGRLNIEAADQGIISAQGKHFPRLTLDANLTERQDPWPYIPAQSPTIGAHFSDSYALWSLNATISLYQGGQITTGVELAKVRERIQENVLTLTRNDLIANTVNTYNKFLQTGKLMEASQASLRALEEQRKNAQLLFDVGRIAKVDLLKVEVQVANEKHRFMFLDESGKTLSATLRFLMGQQPEALPTELTPADSLALPDIEADFKSGLNAARMNRADYLIVRAGVHEAELNGKIAWGKMLPTVGAFGGYVDQYGFNPDYQHGSWVAGVNVSVPLYERSLHADYQREKLQKSRAEQRLLSVDNQLRLDIQTAISSLEESRNRVATAEKSISQADESFRIEQDKYKNGAGSMSDLLLSQAAAMTAAANYTQALFDYNTAVVAYRRATGTLEEYLK